MRLKDAREDMGLKQRDVIKSLRDIEPRADASLLSRYETGLALPTPGQLRTLCEIYDARPLDLYEPQEIDLAGCMAIKLRRDTRKGDRHRITRRVSFRVPEGACKSLDYHKLEACGYSSRQSWFDACLRRLEAQYAAVTKHKGGNTND